MCLVDKRGFCVNTTIRNTFITGVALLFIVIFMVFYEVIRAKRILESFSSLESSVERGFKAAEKEYDEGHARFLRWDGEVTGITGEELDGVYAEYAPFYNHWLCVVGGQSGINQFAIDLSSAQYNDYYVTAYNRRLKTIIDNGETIIIRQSKNNSMILGF